MLLYLSLNFFQNTNQSVKLKVQVSTTAQLFIKGKICDYPRK